MEHQSLHRSSASPSLLPFRQLQQQAPTPTRQIDTLARAPPVSVSHPASMAPPRTSGNGALNGGQSTSASTSKKRGRPTKKQQEVQQLPMGPPPPPPPPMPVAEVPAQASVPSGSKREKRSRSKARARSYSESDDSEEDDRRRRRYRSKSRSHAQGRSRSRARARSRSRSASRRHADEDSSGSESGSGFSASDSDLDSEDRRGRKRVKREAFVVIVLPDGRHLMRALDSVSSLQKVKDTIVQRARLARGTPLALSYPQDGIELELEDEEDFASLCTLARQEETRIYIHSRTNSGQLPPQASASLRNQPLNSVGNHQTAQGLHPNVNHSSPRFDGVSSPVMSAASPLPPPQAHAYFPLAAGSPSFTAQAQQAHAQATSPSPAPAAPSAPSVPSAQALVPTSAAAPAQEGPKKKARKKKESKEAVQKAKDQGAAESGPKRPPESRPDTYDWVANLPALRKITEQTSRDSSVDVPLALARSAAAAVEPEVAQPSATEQPAEPAVKQKRKRRTKDEMKADREAKDAAKESNQKGVDKEREQAPVAEAMTEPIEAGKSGEKKKKKKRDANKANKEQAAGEGEGEGAEIRQEERRQAEERQRKEAEEEAQRKKQDQEIKGRREEAEEKRRQEEAKKAANKDEVAKESANKEKATKKEEMKKQKAMDAQAKKQEEKKRKADEKARRDEERKEAKRKADEEKEKRRLERLRIIAECKGEAEQQQQEPTIVTSGVSENQALPTTVQAVASPSESLAVASSSPLKSPTKPTAKSPATSPTKSPSKSPTKSPTKRRETCGVCDSSHVHAFYQCPIVTQGKESVRKRLEEISAKTRKTETDLAAQGALQRWLAANREVENVVADGDDASSSVGYPDNMSDDGGQERIPSVDLKQQARIEKSVREAQAKVASFHKSQEERKQRQLRGEITVDAAEAKKENAKIKRAETTLRKAEEKMNDFIRSSQEAGKGDSTFSSDNPFQKQQVPPSALPPSSPQRLGQLSQMTPPERQQESLMQREEHRFGSEDELDTSPMLEAATNGRLADDEDVAPLDQETDERSAARRRENHPLFFQTQSTQGVESQTQSETQPTQSPSKTLASASEEVGYQKPQTTAEASSATDSETSSDSNDDPGSEESSEDSDEGEEQDSAPPPAQHPPKSPRQEPTTPKVNGIDKESSVEPVEESSADEKDDEEEEEDEIESTPPANRTSIFGFIRNALANNATTSTPTRGSSGDASAEVASRMQPRRKTGSRLSDLNPNVIRASISSAQNSPISQSAPQLTTSGNNNRRATAASEGSSTDDDSSSDEDDSDSSSSSEDTGKKTGVSSSQPLPASKRAGATTKPPTKKPRKSGLAKLM